MSDISRRDAIGAMSLNVAAAASPPTTSAQTSAAPSATSGAMPAFAGDHFADVYPIRV